MILRYESVKTAYMTDSCRLRVTLGLEFILGTSVQNYIMKDLGRNFTVNTEASE